MMNEMVIKLNSVNAVYEFNNIAKDQDFVIDVKSLDRHYCLDAKSLMGLFSLDLSQPVIIIASVADDRADKFFDAIAKFA